MNTYGNYGNGYGTDPGLTAAFFSLFLIASLFSLVLYIFCGIAGTAFLKKAKHPRSWAAWVPVYNNWVLLEVGKQAGFWSLLPLAGSIVGFIPILGQIIYFFAVLAGFVALVFAIININKSLGYENNLGGMTALGAILYPVWLGIIAWNKSTFDYNRGTPGPFFLPSVGNQQMYRPYAGATSPNYPYDYGQQNQAYRNDIGQSSNGYPQQPGGAPTGYYGQQSGPVSPENRQDLPPEPRQ